MPYQDSTYPWVLEDVCLWWTLRLRWCQSTYYHSRKLSWNSHQDPTSGSSSGLHLSSKYLPGVLDDVDVLDGAGDGVKVIIKSIGNFIESFIKIKHQEPCQDDTYPPRHLLESWRTWRFLMKQEMVSGGGEQSLEDSLKVSSRWNIRNIVQALFIVKHYGTDGTGQTVWIINIDKIIWESVRSRYVLHNKFL